MRERRSPLSIGLLAFVVLSLAGCGSILCPGDVPMTPVSTTSTGYPTAAACNTARTAANACGPLITAPTAACNTHCTSGTFGNFCIGSATNAYNVVGQACYPVDTSPVTFVFACVKAATCSCV